MGQKECCFCGENKDLNNYLPREDRKGDRYAACVSCMAKKGRLVDEPAQEERGGGCLFHTWSDE